MALEDTIGGDRRRTPLDVDRTHRLRTDGRDRIDHPRELGTDAIVDHTRVGCEDGWLAHLGLPIVSEDFLRD